MAPDFLNRLSEVRLSPGPPALPFQFCGVDLSQTTEGLDSARTAKSPFPSGFRTPIAARTEHPAGEYAVYRHSRYSAFLALGTLVRQIVGPGGVCASDCTLWEVP